MSAWTVLLATYAEGVRAGLKELGPHLIGFDPRELSKLNHRMDAALKGHPYVKSGIDMACWDILGKATGLPVCTLLGGRFGESIRLYPRDLANATRRNGAQCRRLPRGRDTRVFN